MPGYCSLRLTRRYAEPPEEVWQALTEPAARARWLRPGFPVEQRAVDPGRVLELDWRPPGEEPSLVRIELRASGAGTELVLDHERIEAQAGMQAMRFWPGTLDRLGAAA
jgi:uncharacterized protein YndB with AHSA1/START domain